MRRLWNILFRREEGRLTLLGFIIVACLASLGFSLYEIQVEQSAHFDASQVRQTLRLVEVPGVRGRIFDRKGNCLADSRPSYDAVLYFEELYDEWRARIRGEVRLHGKRLEPGRRDQILIQFVHERAEQLGRMLGLRPHLDDRAIRRHSIEQRPLPFVVFADLSPSALAIAMERYPLPGGLAIEPSALRRYRYGPVAAHTLGYVTRGRPTLEMDAELPTYSLPEVRGVSGVELRFDEHLRGEPGMRTLLVNARGYKEKELGYQPPRPGDDLVLSLDLDCQRAAEQAMGDHPGAAVVLDPRNGDVLALVSSPGFDPNRFIPRVRQEDMDALLKDPAKPLLNRAVNEHYAPGSTFKLMVTLAGLDSGKLSAGSSSVCTGQIVVGNQLKRCWIRSKGGEHGTVNLRSALVHSCNIFFYEHGMDIGMAQIAAMARQFHLGEPTGIDLPREARGLVPDPAKRRYRPAETANVSIGQGELDTTVLQMACVTAAIANGGTLVTPRLALSRHQPSESGGPGPEVYAFPPRKHPRLALRPGTMETLRQAMLGVVQDADGTGRKAGIPGVQIAGKTGTAQVMDAQNNIIGHRAWFVSFAPYKDPRYAVAVMIEDGDSGGQTAAPIVCRIYHSLFGIPLPPEKNGATIGQRPAAPASATASRRTG